MASLYGWLDGLVNRGYKKAVGKKEYGEPPFYDNIISNTADWYWMMGHLILTSRPPIYSFGGYHQPMEGLVGTVPVLLHTSSSAGCLSTAKVTRAQEEEFGSGTKSGTLEHKATTARVILGLLCTMACLLLASLLFIGPKATLDVAIVCTAAVAVLDAKRTMLLKFPKTGATLACAPHRFNTVVTKSTVVTKNLKPILTRSTSFATLWALLALVPQVSGTPLPPRKYPGPDFEEEYRTAWHYVRPWVPWVEVLVTAGYIIKMYLKPVAADGRKPPVTLGTSAMMAAFVWFAVGTKQPDDDESFVPIVLTTFACAWVSFMAKSRRPLEYKDAYLSCILLIGAAASLSVTSLCSRSVSWDEYWSQFAMIAPLALTVTSVVVYAWWPWKSAARDHQE